MASTAAAPQSVVDPEDLASFTEHLRSSKKILALLGAGLSASSGLPTFRGAGGLWRTHNATDLATPEAWQAQPGLVWQFYNYRRHMALTAKPNRAHLALAELARKKDFLTLSQNVDGLSQRAGHPPEKLKLLHGSLFDVKCSSFFCNHVERDNYTDPITPALAIPTDPAGEAIDPTTDAARDLDISDASVPLPSLTPDDLPKCPKCKTGLLRPGVVWFGEMLPEKTLSEVCKWMTDAGHIDLMLVIGTSSKVYPAAGYVDKARRQGARVAVVNMDRSDAPGAGLAENDWFFQGDAGVIVPEILKDVIGELPEEVEDLARTKK